MGDFIDITQLSAAVSTAGISLLLLSFRVRRSKSWESSSGLKRFLLIVSGLLFQVPVVIVMISKPVVVKDTLSTESWTWKNLLINYIMMVGAGVVVYVIALVTGRYDASK